MKLTVAVLIGVTCAAAPVHAQTVDPLWKKTVEQAQSAKKWIAQDVDMDVTDKTAPPGQARTLNHAHLTSWSKGKPAYDAVQLEPKPEPGKADSDSIGPEVLDMLVGLGQSAAVLGAAVTRSDGQSLDGQSWTVFHVVKDKLTGKLDIKFWVDPETGCMHHSEMQFHITLMIKGTLSASYLPSLHGGCLASKTVIDAKSLVPFSNIDVRMINTPSNWVVRPL